MHATELLTALLEPPRLAGDALPKEDNRATILRALTELGAGSSTQALAGYFSPRNGGVSSFSAPPLLSLSLEHLPISSAESV